MRYKDKMKKNFKLISLVIAVILIGGVLVGCTGGGISQEAYNSLQTQFEAAQEQVTQLQGEAGKLQSENQNIKDQLKATQGQTGELESQIGSLKEQYELVGKTPAETAANIVRQYHETHTYSVTDLFVCGDMASDVWNMLETQGIGAVIQVGNVETAVIDILASDHAWVVAEVAPGQKLALETTAGRVVTKEENPLYYKGWYFANPKDYKRFSELMKEYNVRVDIINQLQAAKAQAAKDYQEANEYGQELADEYNSKYASTPDSIEARLHMAKIESQLVMVDEKEGRYDQLQGLIAGQEAKMREITAEMNNLATKCSG